MALIGISIAMGMLRLPRLKDYWSTSNVLLTPWFRSIMSRNKILSYLHLVDSSQQKKKGEEGYDPIFKARPLGDSLHAVFSEYYKPSWHLSTDEMMIRTRCRVSFLQYIPKEPTRFSIKMWGNSEAKTGYIYVLFFQVYTGAVGNGKSSGLGHRVVMGHCLFIDNFYTSPKLPRDLLHAEIYRMGSIRINRKDFRKEVIPDESNLSSGIMQFAISKLLGDQGEMVAVW